MSRIFWNAFLDGLSLRPMFHGIAHIFGLNYGRVYSWLDEGKIMVGFRCDDCDRIDSVHETTKSNTCTAQKDGGNHADQT